MAKNAVSFFFRDNNPLYWFWKVPDRQNFDRNRGNIDYFLFI